MEEWSRGWHHSCPHDGNITKGGVGTSTLGHAQGGLEELQAVYDTHEVICTQKDEGRLLVLSGQEVVQDGSWVLDQSSCGQSGENVSIFSCVRVAPVPGESTRQGKKVKVYLNQCLYLIVQLC